MVVVTIAGRRGGRQRWRLWGEVDSPDMDEQPIHEGHLLPQVGWQSAKGQLSPQRDDGVFVVYDVQLDHCRDAAHAARPICETPRGQDASSHPRMSHPRIQSSRPGRAPWPPCLSSTHGVGSPRSLAPPCSGAYIGWRWLPSS